MISFNYETDFQLDNEDDISAWISQIILSENKKEGDINYIFCDDDYLVQINQQYLNHDTLTDIISFDYSVGNELHGDIFISVERVRDNAVDYNVSFSEELQRVLAHGAR
jgi:probable rRNA maturation factor